jgi:hypothetical protein
MADSLIPDSAELKKLSKQKAELFLSRLLEEWVEELRVDGDVEDKRKAVALLLEWTGWKEPPPKDPLAHLPRANIVINLGDDTPKSVQVGLDFGSPTPQMLECLDVNSEIIDDAD